MEHVSATEYIRANGLCKSIGRISGIYAITIQNRVVYIGKSTNLISRVTRHIRNALNGHKRPKYQILNSAICDGKFVNCVVIEECGEKELSEREEHYIIKFNPPLNTTKSNDVSSLTFKDLIDNLSNYDLVGTDTN